MCGYGHGHGKLVRQGINSCDSEFLPIAAMIYYFAGTTNIIHTGWSNYNTSHRLSFPHNDLQSSAKHCWCLVLKDLVGLQVTRR